MWSLLAAAVGIAVSAAVVQRLSAAGDDREGEVYWALGLAALTPAWIVEFLAIIGAGAEPGREVRLFAMASVGVAMAGVLLSNTFVRRFAALGGRRRPFAGWLLGVAALVPAWALAFVGRSWLR